MIHGVGTDIVAIARVERMLSEHGERTEVVQVVDAIVFDHGALEERVLAGVRPTGPSEH